jgi:hypothetical protein
MDLVWGLLSEMAIFPYAIHISRLYIFLASTPYLPRPNSSFCPTQLVECRIIPCIPWHCTSVLHHPSPDRVDRTAGLNNSRKTWLYCLDNIGNSTTVWFNARPTKTNHGRFVISGMHVHSPPARDRMNFFLCSCRGTECVSCTTLLI